ncbi:SpoVR family protein [Mesorhizobium sp. KR1-2]|uniref:SpoVR family protein n=1 Tax=Mesorhizobium sp. KR1-2 TaxID=3156609 RepID=UPI0032B31F78
MCASKGLQEPLFHGSDWNFDILRRIYDAVEEVAYKDLHLDTYTNQLEIISAEQMMDAYSSIGMPLMYRHWSFGKRYLRDEQLYRKGHMGLAYEMVINSDPCICYLMEGNTAALQTLVIAHAAFGHNHFFKNNQLFRQWTDAGAILTYLDFAKNFVRQCEELHGIAAVESILDAAHALMEQGVFRYRRPGRLSAEQGKARERERIAHAERTFSDLWRTLPSSSFKSYAGEAGAASQSSQEENILYFIEKNSPILKPWQREIVRIVRFIAQYFYPQRQTKMMNEGCATFVHYTIVNLLFERGLIEDGHMLEIMHNHTDVVFQPGFNDLRYGGLNPYTLGFEMMRDIQRVCTKPTPEDRDWFPDIAGKGAWLDVLLDAWVSHRDESFIRQYLSPSLIRKMRLFAVTDYASKSYVEVTAIHDERGYESVRSTLADSYDVSSRQPDIQVIGADLAGDRCLRLQHNIRDGVGLQEESRDATLRHLATLWGYEVRLTGIDEQSGQTVYQQSMRATPEKVS